MNRVKEFRKLRGLTQEKVAESIGKTKGQISKIETGGLELTAWWLENLAKALGCRPQDIISNDEQESISMIGTVGEGGKIQPVHPIPFTESVREHREAAPGNAEFVEPLPESGHRDVTALRVKGDSMLPFMPDGALVYYNGRLTAGFDKYLGSLCVVQLRDGSLFLKTLRRGYSYNRYNLVSYNGETMEDVDIVWCAKAGFIKLP